MQIALLQVLQAGLRNLDLGVFMLALSFFAAVALTVASVEVVDRARSGAGIDRLYRAVFN